MTGSVGLHEFLGPLWRFRRCSGWGRLGFGIGLLVGEVRLSISAAASAGVESGPGSSPGVT